MMEMSKLHTERSWEFDLSINHLQDARSPTGAPDQLAEQIFRLFHKIRWAGVYLTGGEGAGCSREWTPMAKHALILDPRHSCLNDKIMSMPLSKPC